MTHSDNEGAFSLYADDPLMTVEEAADYLKIGKTTMNKLRREQKIPCIRITSDTRFRRSDLNRFADDQTTWGWFCADGERV
jgi:excisionase family DNA binding protein